eukprot:CAMPEP_0113608832 /NCGR_PEP_ID=MMETSP0017_2-20120614/4142_1 /TAXON_ID=2856 /ORGANISM="Cylindrotheca closterium" /LENGTH=763 /DNA_ID=CAMNT_0000517557 /DNA_START=102 /DNA_END=2393 /DNA_ORIENTATION=- /assembly_acc=CAM_ASM_000147
MSDGDKGKDIALCASCDRCRSRKTKCDGGRPCTNCAAKYMKKHKLTSVDGVPMEAFECHYSPAKRRGPVPGRSGQSRKASEAFGRGMGGGFDGMDNFQQGMGGVGGIGGVQSMEELQLRQIMLQANMGGHQGLGTLDQGASFLDTQQAAIQQQINLIQQLQAQQNLEGRAVALAAASAAADMEPPTRRLKTAEAAAKPANNANASSSGGSAAGGSSNNRDANGVPRTIAAHTHLLELSDPDGSRLRAYYRLSVDELFGFPPTPTDEEYCMRLNIPGMTPRMIPGTHLAALSAARFAEVALGAVVHNEVSLGMELCNAVVHCLRESVQEPVQPPYMFEVARSYFLLGVFRAFRGDMVRYFKYRRVCLTYISKLENDASAATLLAAVAFLDAWAYMIYNADEKRLPNIDKTIPPVEGPMQTLGSTATELEYNVKTNPGQIASDPKNQNWIQGAPPIYLNNEAPLPARSLDALACAVRTCCDQANGRFAAISKEAKTTNMEAIPQETIITPTTTAVLAHENELCSRNMVLSAFSLLQQYEAATPSSHKNQGIHLIISALDAFLDNGDEEENGGFTDAQIQSLLSVCNTTIENPLLMHHGGPTYHMVSNAAIMLCHLLNGMYAMKGPELLTAQEGDMEAAMFEEVLDTFIAVRKLLMIHRRKLPAKLRCHGIPRAPIGVPQEGMSFIDLGETILCSCRGCQGFVLMACSPCVAAERAQKAADKRKVETGIEGKFDSTDMDQDLAELDNDFNLDDDALLGMLSQLIAT